MCVCSMWCQVLVYFDHNGTFHLITTTNTATKQCADPNQPPKNTTECTRQVLQHLWRDIHKQYSLPLYPSCTHHLFLLTLGSQFIFTPIPPPFPSLPLALHLTPHLTFFADSTICIQLSPSLVTSCLGYDLHSPTRLICHSTTPYPGPIYSFPASGPNPNPAHLSTSLFNHHQSEKWSQPEMSSISLHRSCLTLSFSSSLFFCSRIPASAVAVSSLPPGCMGWCQIKSLTTWDTFFLIV